MGCLLCDGLGPMKPQHMLPIATLQSILKEDRDAIPAFMSSDLTFNQLTEAAGLGCRFCDTLRSGVLAFVAADDIVRLSLYQQIQEKSYEPRFGHILPLRIQIITYAKGTITLLFYVRSGGVIKSMPRFPEAPHVSLDSSSSECLSKARTWLSRCMRDHSSLRCVSAGEKVLPTRVIHVGDELNDLHLYEPKAGERGVWAALSYCWGKKQVLTTRKASLAAHKSRIAIDELPKTCRDAVLVARALSIRYLWIDALCIVQDSPEDWEREASRMCSVYKDAMITFAAPDSESSDMGLFLNRERDIVEMEVELDDYVGTVHARRATQNFDPPLHGHPKWSPRGPSYGKPAVLKTRAWTMQELMLSQRILWFGSAEIGWSCWSSTACECEPEQTFEYLDNTLYRYHDINEGFKLSSSFIANDLTAIDWLTIWGELVQKYTLRDLTVASDRLPAMSGLAAVLKPRIHSQYLAGLWNIDLPKQLLWISLRSAFPDSDKFSSMYEDQYAPSWSWASVPGEVRLWTYDSDNTRGRSNSIWRILSVDFRNHGLNQFGPGEGSLTIESYLLPVRWIDDQLVYQQTSGPTTNADGLRFVYDDDIMWDPRTRTSDLNSLRVNTLWILAGSLQGPGFNKWSQFKGLVLERLSNLHTYVRLGYVETTFHLSETTSWEAWQQRSTWTVVELV